MHTFWKPAAALAVSCGIAGAAAPAATPAATAPAPAVAKPAALGDRAQIQALEKDFAAAVAAKNVDKIMSYYARDGLFVFDVSPPRQHVGWADYRKDWQDFLGVVAGPTNFALSDLVVASVGPVAWSHSIQGFRYTAKDGSKKAFVVRVTDVYRKLAGKWLIVQEHVSVPVDLDTGKPDLMSKP